MEERSANTRTSHANLYENLLKDLSVLTNQEFFELKARLEKYKGGEKGKNES